MFHAVSLFFDAMNHINQFQSPQKEFFASLMRNGNNGELERLVSLLTKPDKFVLYASVDSAFSVTHLHPR